MLRLSDLSAVFPSIAVARNKNTANKETDTENTGGKEIDTNRSTNDLMARIKVFSHQQSSSGSINFSF
jgi:hypothetical protein